MSARKGTGWSGNVGGNVPVQGEGRVDGLPWYFRARWRAWSFHVAGSPDGDPLDAEFVDNGWLMEEAWGDDDFAAGWMADDDAWQLIEKAIAAFRAAKQASARSP